MADDPNGDRLRYRIDYRQRGGGGWRNLAVNLRDPVAWWETSGMADGVYELRVEADDSPDNRASDTLRGLRVSRPFTVDNTPPVISGLIVSRDGAIRFRVKDAGGPIRRAVIWASGRDTQEVRPDDGAADSPTENFSAHLAAFFADVRLVLVMVEDDHGNWAVAEAAMPSR